MDDYNDIGCLGLIVGGIILLGGLGWSAMSWYAGGWDVSHQEVIHGELQGYVIASCGLLILVAASILEWRTGRQ